MPYSKSTIKQYYNPGPYTTHPRPLLHNTAHTHPLLSIGSQVAQCANVIPYAGRIAITQSGEFVGPSPFPQLPPVLFFQRVASLNKKDEEGVGSVQIPQPPPSMGTRSDFHSPNHTAGSYIILTPAKKKDPTELKLSFTNLGVFVLFCDNSSSCVFLHVQNRIRGRVVHWFSVVAHTHPPFVS